MHIQIASRLYYYTGNKAFPNFPHTVTQILQPLAAAAVVPKSTFRITTITNRHRTTCELTEGVCMCVWMIAT